MTNYFKTVGDLHVTQERINYLETEIAVLSARLTSTQTPNSEAVQSPISHDKILNSVIRIDELQRELKEEQEKADRLTAVIDKMHEAQTYYKQTNDIKSKVFAFCHMQGFKPAMAALRIPCSLSTVYKYLDEIKKDT